MSEKTYIVYKRTSPSGHSYVGYTKNTLMDRWKRTILDCQNTKTPLANAIRKYGTDAWQHVILLETEDKQLAMSEEKRYIELYGYYNVAKGGDGGNTGRNGDPDKRKRQSATMKARHAITDPAILSERSRKGIETSKANGTYNPRKFIQTGRKHGKHKGTWVCAGIEYETLVEAAEKTGYNQSTILKLCVHRVDIVVPKAVTKKSLVPSGKTPRECGWYKRNTDE